MTEVPNCVEAAAAVLGLVLEKGRAQGGAMRRCKVLPGLFLPSASYTLQIKATMCKQSSASHTRTFAQATAVQYLKAGHMPATLANVRTVYDERALAMSAALKRELGHAIAFTQRPPLSAAAPMHLRRGLALRRRVWGRLRWGGEVAEGYLVRDKSCALVWTQRYTTDIRLHNERQQNTGYPYNMPTVPAAEFGLPI